MEVCRNIRIVSINVHTVTDVNITVSVVFFASVVRSVDWSSIFWKPKYRSKWMFFLVNFSDFGHDVSLIYNAWIDSTVSYTCAYSVVMENSLRLWMGKAIVNSIFQSRWICDSSIFGWIEWIYTSSSDGIENRNSWSGNTPSSIHYVSSSTLIARTFRNIAIIGPTDGTNECVELVLFESFTSVFWDRC